MFSTCIFVLCVSFGFLFSQVSVIDYFVFYFVERNYWKIFHTEYKIDFMILTVTTHARMKMPCTMHLSWCF